VATRIGFWLAMSGIAPSCGDSGHLLGRAGAPDAGAGSDGAPGKIDGSGADGPPKGDASGLADGGSVACSGLGPHAVLPTSGGLACASALTTRYHRFAVCLCDSLNVTAPLYTDYFDSTGGPTSSQPPAAVGINGDLQASARLQAFGSVAVVGAGGITSSDTLVSLGSLYVPGPMHIPSGDVEAAEDVYAGGNIQGILIVGGTLYIDPSANDALAIISAAYTVRVPLVIEQPCDCNPGAVEVTGAIDTAMARNDNAMAGIAPDRLAAVTSSTLLDIPCGTYALTSIDTQQSLVLAVHGRAVVAVAGDVTLRAGFTVTLDPGAELDLLVGGRLLTSGSNSIGSMTPARFRIWVAGSQTVVFDDDPMVGAVVHAAGAQVTASSGLELSGALFAKTLTSGAKVNVHFDQAVFSIGASCGEPPATAVP
jgi:hypothetical protein